MVSCVDFFGFLSMGHHEGTSMRMIVADRTATDFGPEPVSFDLWNHRRMAVSSMVLAETLEYAAKSRAGSAFCRSLNLLEPP